MFPLPEALGVSCGLGVWAGGGGGGDDHKQNGYEPQQGGRGTAVDVTAARREGC